MYSWERWAVKSSEGMVPSNELLYRSILVSRTRLPIELGMVPVRPPEGISLREVTSLVGENEEEKATRGYSDWS